MTSFTHISDAGVRSYLEDEAKTSCFQTAAMQLDAAEKHLKHSYCKDLERAAWYYKAACEEFGLRRLGRVRKNLQSFWKVGGVMRVRVVYQMGRSRTTEDCVLIKSIMMSTGQLLAVLERDHGGRRLIVPFSCVVGADKTFSNPFVEEDWL